MLSSTAILFVMQDINDNAPSFSQSVYMGRIMENHSVGTTVGVTVIATDPEAEHTITYFPVTSDAESSFFSVGRTDGIIRLAQEVDYDPPANHREFSFRVILSSIFDCPQSHSIVYNANLHFTFMVEPCYKSMHVPLLVTGFDCMPRYKMATIPC